MVHRLSDNRRVLYAEVVTRAFGTAIGRGASILPGTFRDIAPDWIRGFSRTPLAVHFQISLSIYGLLPGLKMSGQRFRVEVWVSNV